MLPLAMKQIQRVCTGWSRNRGEPYITNVNDRLMMQDRLDWQKRTYRGAKGVGRTLA
jgi:hypothetical protein